ncbi:MAG: hypothetical protein WBD31_20980, partial [Rubripirellula sp.]
MTNLTKRCTSVVLTFCMVAWMSIAATGNCHGALIVRFDAANYDGVAGGMVDVTLLLEATDESGSGGVDHTFLFADGGNDGLFSLGVMVMNDNFAGAAQVAAVSDIAVNTTVFDDDGTALGMPGIQFTSVGVNSASLQAVSADVAEGIEDRVTQVGPFIVEIATLTYTLGPTIGAVTTLSLADFGLGDDWNSADASLPSFDSIVNFSATATITAVPEPSGLSVLLIGGLWLLPHRRRRKN